MLNINLLPWRETQKQKRCRQALVAFLSASAIIFSATLSLRLLVMAYNKAIVADYQQVAAKTARLYIIQGKLTLPGLSKKYLLKLKDMQSEREKLLTHLKTIVIALPKSCYLIDIHYHRKIWLIHGKSDGIRSIKIFIENLKIHHQFQHISLINILKKPDFMFSISIS